YAKYKTFAFIGGVENLMMFPANPGLVSDRIHEAVTRELTKKGLREVAANQRPDLVVRFWGNPSSQVNVATMGVWGPYGPYTDGNWAWTYNEVSASSAKEGSLIVDLIDPRTRELVWRLYLIHKISTPDKEWKKADEEISQGCESYPPRTNEKDAKKKERAAHAGKA
ncbi:MAG: DUF4136 domain-containing protein, partial [Candidatus Acidiferrum sp.]